MNLPASLMGFSPLISHLCILGVQMMTGDGWSDVVRDLYESRGDTFPGGVWGINIFFVSYMVSASSSCADICQP